MVSFHKNILSYVKATSWTENYSRGNIIGLNKESEFINIPIDHSYADYEENLYRVVEKIARQENREYLQVLEDIIYVDYDKIYLRIFDEPSPLNSSLLTFENAIQKIVHFKSSLIYTAASAENPKKFYMGQHSKKVSDYASNTFLGHTQKGSFIFPAYVKIPPKISSELESTPFNRSANKKFEEATHFLEESLNTTSYEKLLTEESVLKGISANYMDNIGKILEQTNEEKIEIYTRWAVTRKEEDLGTQCHVFETKDREVIIESVRLLKESNETKEVTLICEVKSLKNSDDHDKTITLRTEEDKKMVSFQIENPAQDIIEISTKAFESDQYIECKGILEIENKRKQLKNIEFFSLRDTKEDSLFS